MRMLRPLCASVLRLCVFLLLSAGSAQAATHPLEPLSADEIKAAGEIVLARFRDDADLPDEPLRFSIINLAEPKKSFVLGWSPGLPFPRRAELSIIHYPTNRAWVAEVDLETQRVLKLELQAPGTQPALTSEEYVAAAEVIRAYPPFTAAMQKRGLDPDLVYIDVWAPGDLELPDALAETLEFGQNTRLVRCPLFYRGAPVEAQDPAVPQNPYDRPIEGVVITLDLNARKVIAMTDTVQRPVNAETGNVPQTRKLKPLIVTQPEGSSIQIEGRLVRWNRWQFYVVLHPREGLVLYDVRFEDAGVWRPIAYRLALSEIYVPYGLGDPNWVWRSAFDVGEYNAGTLAQSLEVNRDVPENTQLMDAVFYSDVGPTPDNPTGTIDYPGTIGLYERDSGILWTRTDPTTVDRDTRFGRELVVTWNCWIGNYIYVFDWIFKLDGSIEVKVNLTGTTLNQVVDATPDPSAAKVGIDGQGVLVAAPNHQHFLNFRLDLDVDGAMNQVMEMEAAPRPETGFKNAFGAVMTHLESEGFRDVNPYTARHWHIESATKTNPYGKPTSYALEPSSFAFPYSAPDFPGLLRAQFAQHQLWLTRYQDGELYAAGQYPNQAKSVEGVTVYTAPAEPLHHEDVVVWYTTGFTHLAKPEDYPVMPTESIGFKLQPRGFFVKNPAMDVVDQGLTP